jgi:hypothetical protein
MQDRDQGRYLVKTTLNTIGFIKCRKYLEKVNNHQHLKKDSGPKN